MEKNFRIILQAFFVIVVLLHISLSKDEGFQRSSSCPEEVRTHCHDRGRHACVGREKTCGDCLKTQDTLVGDHCLRLDADIPEKDLDDIIEKAAASRRGDRFGDKLGQKDEDPTAKEIDVPGVNVAGGDSEEHQEERENVAAKDTVVNREVEETQAHEGEIVLEEWQFMLIVGGCIVFAVVGVAIAFYCCYRIQLSSKDPDADYPSYGVTGPGAAISGDRKLAQSAQMYHYQHQKQQMIAMQKRENGEKQQDGSDYDSDEENEDGDLTVYECPGLAPTGEMQVKNPLFSEEQYTEPANEVEAEDKP